MLNLLEQAWNDAEKLRDVTDRLGSEVTVLPQMRLLQSAVSFGTAFSPLSSFRHVGHSNMAVACCPHCRVNLHINPEFAGQTLQCPNCRGAFIAPGEDELITPDEDEGFPLLVVLVCVAGANIVLFMMLAIVSPRLAFFLAGFAVLVQLAVWKRKELTAVFRQVCQSDTTKRIVEKTASRLRNGAEAVHSHLSQPTASATGDEIVAVEVIDETDDALVEIRPAKTARSHPRTVSHISQPNGKQERPSMWGRLSGRPLEANLPRDNVYFYGCP